MGGGVPGGFPLLQKRLVSSSKATAETRPQENSEKGPSLDVAAGRERRMYPFVFPAFGLSTHALWTTLSLVTK